MKRRISGWRAAGPPQVARFLADNFARLLVRVRFPHTRRYRIVAERRAALH